ncbi:MAG: hypothetical protein ACRD1L_11790, partial [Terriglobales bacterium]
MRISRRRFLAAAPVLCALAAARAAMGQRFDLQLGHGRRAASARDLRDNAAWFEFQAPEATQQANGD